jgi:hypothetical protein
MHHVSSISCNNYLHASVYLGSCISLAVLFDSLLRKRWQWVDPRFSAGNSSIRE